MSAYLTPNPLMQFFDVTGAPLYLGTLETFAAGTSTPLATYTDFSAAIANPTTITLNTRGEAAVWLGPAAYKFTLRDAAGVLIWTADNITTQDALLSLAAFETLLAGSTGSTLVGFTQNGPGTTRTVQSKLSDSYSVADFGFSTSNNATANATAFVNAWNISKQLTIPAGTYSVTSLPNFAVRGARIQGIGQVVLNITGAGPGLIVDAGAAPSTTVVSDIVIDNLTINGVNSAAGNVGVFIRGITHSQFNRLRPINWIGSAMYCSYMVSNSFYDFCYSGNEPGISITTLVGISLINRNALDSCSNCTWINPIIEGISGNGISATAAIANTFIGGTIEGCGYTTGYGGIFLGTNTAENSFIGTDLESNGIVADATTFHIKNAGIRNSFINIFADNVLSSLVWITGGNSTNILGGQIASLKIDAGVKNTVATALAYNGTITDAGTDTRFIQRYAITSATTLPDSYVTKGTWTPTVAGIAVVGTPTYTGTYERIGDFVSFTIRVTSTTSTASTAGTTTFSTPTSTVVSGTCVAASGVTNLGLGTGLVNSSLIYPPAWAASADVVITGQYFAA